MKQAIKTWRSLSGTLQQFELVDEVAQDRGTELTLAYRNVIMVAAGYRRCIGSGGKSRRTQEPCVVLVVKKKWPSKEERGKDPQKIPSCLLVHATVDGVRVHCAVPTDVQPQSWFQGASPRGAAIMQVGAGEISGRGTATCAVLLGTGAQAMKLLLSAHHVLSPFPNVTAGVPQSGFPIARLTNGDGQTAQNTFATSSSWGGTMRADGEPSFDAQFAEVTDWTAARTALSRLKISTDLAFAGSPAQVMWLGKTTAFHILVPSDNPRWNGGQHRPPIRVQADLVLPDSYGFKFPVREGKTFVTRHLTFERLVRMKLFAGADAPLNGDSGAAVVAPRADGTHTLIGLFIASGNDYAYAIPAWQLFDADYYARLPNAGPITPVSA